MAFPEEIYFYDENLEGQ